MARFIVWDAKKNKHFGLFCGQNEQEAITEMLKEKWHGLKDSENLIAEKISK